MKVNCNDNGGCNEVEDWQWFLKNNGYLSLSFTVNGVFDNVYTVPATKRFQSDFTSYGLIVNGTVDEKTYAFATGSTFANIGTDLMSHDNVTPTPEDQISCP